MQSHDVKSDARQRDLTAISLNLPFSRCVGPAIVRSIAAADLAFLLSADSGVVEFKCLQLDKNVTVATRYADFEVATRDEVVYVIARPEPDQVLAEGVILISPLHWSATRLANLKTLAGMVSGHSAAAASIRLAAILSECEYINIGEAAEAIGVPDPLGVIARLFFENRVTLRIDAEPLSLSTQLAGPAVDSVVERIIDEASR